MSNVTLAKYLQKREADKKSGRQIERPETRPGSLSEQTSLFKPDVEIQGFRDELSAEEREQLLKRDREAREALHRRYSDRLAASKLDPDPSGRKRLERKLVIRSIRRRGRLTKDQTLARTERQLLWQSQMLPTSVKKLTRLMHMIQGKTIEEAMVQLRFSAKKVAVDVIKGLQIARDEAIAGRGMGLGFTLPSPQPTSTTTIAKETDAALDESAETEAAEEEGNRKAKGPRVSKREQEELLLLDGTRIRPKIGEPKTIELRNGKHMKVYDPTALYIDQAWVGRGPQTQEPEFRARGKVNLLYHRTTSEFLSTSYLSFFFEKGNCHDVS
jgi:ribosomal protein L22